ncbi:ENR1 protein, partial [Calyptomena viridis]|nr:ENR1 protein [Calyptomena viridis]
REQEDLELSSGKNLFIDLMEKVSRELSLRNCWVCGDTQMSEMWPWEGISLNPVEILKWKQTKQQDEIITKRGEGQWSLKTKIIGEECITRKG